jgi:hypothetical protein
MQAGQPALQTLLKLAHAAAQSSSLALNRQLAPQFSVHSALLQGIAGELAPAMAPLPAPSRPSPAPTCAPARFALAAASGLLCV